MTQYACTTNFEDEKHARRDSLQRTEASDKETDASSPAAEHGEELVARKQGFDSSRVSCIIKAGSWPFALMVFTSCLFDAILISMLLSYELCILDSQKTEKGSLSWHRMLRLIDVECKNVMYRLILQGSDEYRLIGKLMYCLK